MTSKRRAFPSVVFLLSLIATALSPLLAQGLNPQQLAFAGLRSVNQQGQFNAVVSDASGNLYLLLDQKDGVRVLKTDAGETTVLAQVRIGAAGDIGLGMALDPSGNVYVTGTSTSGSLAGTAGAAFPTAADTTTNAFVTKFDSSLNVKFTTFGGSGRIGGPAIAATSDAVFITGLIYGTGLPVTPGGIIQAPAPASSQNGFVEKFSADGTTLLYATYISGANGDTSPTTITVDAQDDAYIGGFTTATGFPTIAALIPRAVGTTSGFMAELTPQGDGITFSTFLPGYGISSLALDPSGKTLLLSGTIALGQFPVATVTTPLVSGTDYQVLLRMALDGSAVLSSTVLAPAAQGTQSFLAPAPSGAVWVEGALSTPLLPGTALSSIGNSFAVRVSPNGTSGSTLIDQTVRFGGLAASNPNYASAPVNLTSLVVDANGSALFAGGLAPGASASLLATQTFDVPLTNAPTAALPSAVHDAVLPAGSCNGSSQCAGGAAYLARVTPTAAPSLALSTDGSPLILLRNLGSVQATAVQITATGFTTSTDCGTTLNAGGECTILLTGSGPGSLTIQASNATTQTASLAAVPSTITANTLVFSPRELDFGIQTSTSPAATRTITITNLGSQTQTFTSALNGLGHTPYTFAETSSDCTASGISTTKQLAAGATCHVTVGLTASSDSTKDGPAQANWTIGSGNVLLTGYGQAASLSLSAPEIDFGTQFNGGLRSARYLYISNNSAAAVAHTTVATPTGSPFTLTDNCPSSLASHSVCQIQFAYQSPQATSTDSTLLTLDQGMSVLVTGQTIPQPGVNGSTANPSLSVTPTTISFPTPVVVTGVSSGTQTVTIQNTGTSSFSLALSLTGDFTDQTNCVASLAATATCTVVLSFTPSQPGARTGLLGVTAGSGTTPTYVNLSGTATAILPANNGTLDFGNVTVGQPSVQWYKVSQPFSTLSAATLSSTFKVLLVEDTGNGHGQFPASAFFTATTGTCVNCWLGVQFTAPTPGPQTATLSLASSLAGKAYTLALTGNGLAPSGVVLSPVSQDFGPVAVNGSSAPQLFTLTNIATSGAAISLATPALIGDFTLSTQVNGGAACTGTLAPNASCFFSVVFAPTATGQSTGSVSVQTGTGVVSATLTGNGAPDPGIAFNPNALVFNNVPDASATLQTITVTNTGTGAVQVGALSNTSAVFQTSTTCGTLAPAATCTITVTYVPATATVTDTLQVPVTATVGGSPVVTTYTVPLTANYTSGTAGLQIVPAMTNFGPFPADTVGGTRQLTINNLTAKSLALNLVLPRQFVLSGAPCTTLAANGSCSLSLRFVPLTAGDITGSLVAQGTPSDGSAVVGGIGYLEGYGTGTGTLSVSGNIQPGHILNFGQVASGQTARQVLTLTNTSTGVNAGSVTVHRLTSQFPFASATTCGGALLPGQSCTVTVTYAPLNQVASGTSTPPSNADAGTLVIESDAISSPDTLNLAGTSSPTAVSSPSNTAPIATYTLSQSSLTFPATAVGFSSSTQSVTLTNTGTAVLHILGVTASADFAATSTCATLLPGATCTLTATFTPQVSGQTSATRIGSIAIASDAATSLEFVSLAGSANPSTLVFQPAALNFGVAVVGSSTTLPVQITNTGTAAAVFNGITTTGDYTATGTCPANGGSLAASASCTVQVTFKPTATGARPGSLSVANSVSSVPLALALSGTGAQSFLQLSSTSLSFGSVTVGASANLPFTLTNNGTTAITGLTVAATGDYAVTTACAATTLVPAATCTVNIVFTPTAAGTRAGTLTVTSSDPASPAAIPLSGTGVLQSHLQINASSLSFPNTAVGAAANLTLTLTNNGTTSISALVLSATGDFAATTPCASTTLAPAATCTATITFTPTAAGTRTGTLTVTSSDPGSPATVSLSGTGSATSLHSGSFTMTVNGAATASQTVTQSHPASYNVMVAPQQGFTGTIALTCTAIAAAPAANCSMVPSMVTLDASGLASSATVTINTVSSASLQSPASQNTADRIALCLLGPTGFLFWRFRKALRKQPLSLLAAILCTSMMLLVSGCGSSGAPNLRIAPSGTYQYSVTGTSGTAAPQTVTLNLIIQ